MTLNEASKIAADAILLSHDKPDFMTETQWALCALAFEVGNRNRAMTSMSLHIDSLEQLRSHQAERIRQLKEENEELRGHLSGRRS